MIFLFYQLNKRRCLFYKFCIPHHLYLISLFYILYINDQVVNAGFISLEKWWIIGGFLYPRVIIKHAHKYFAVKKAFNRIAVCQAKVLLIADIRKLDAHFLIIRHDTV